MTTPVTQAQAREAIQRARPFGGYGLTEPFEVLLAFIAQHPDAQQPAAVAGKSEAVAWRFFVTDHPTFKPFWTGWGVDAQFRDHMVTQGYRAEYATPAPVPAPEPAAPAVSEDADKTLHAIAIASDLLDLHDERDPAADMRRAYSIVTDMTARIAELESERAEIVKRLGCHPGMLLDELNQVTERADSRPNADDHRQLQSKLTTAERAISAAVRRIDELEAENATLVTSLDANWVTHQRVVAAEREAERLRGVITRLVKADKEYDEARRVSAAPSDDDCELTHIAIHHRLKLAKQCRSVALDRAAIDAARKGETT